MRSVKRPKGRQRRRAQKRELHCFHLFFFCLFMSGDVWRSCCKLSDGKLYTRYIIRQKKRSRRTKQNWKVLYRATQPTQSRKSTGRVPSVWQGAGQCSNKNDRDCNTVLVSSSHWASQPEDSQYHISTTVNRIITYQSMYVLNAIIENVTGNTYWYIL